MKNLNKIFITPYFLISILCATFSYDLFASQSYKTFGFIQSGFSSSTTEKSAYGFQLNRINLISSFDPKSNVTILADVEYEGSTSHSSSGNKGTINLSRGYIDYCLSSKMNFRIGKYLSPFGLYNEIHDFAASYYLIDAPRLYQKHVVFSGVAAQRFYSKYATGIQLYGNIFKNSKGGYLGYGLSLSNGADEKVTDGSDQNRSTAFTFRTYYKPTFYGLQFGISYHREKLVTGIGGLPNDLTQTLAIEFEKESTNFLIQFELAISQFKNPSYSHQNAGLGYIHVAYLKNDKFTPFFEFAHELYDLKQTEKSYNEIIFGLSYNLTSQLFLKTEYINHSNEKDLQEKTDTTYKLSIDAMF